MHLHRLSPIAAALLILSSGSTLLRAQAKSLADVAKKEEERRKAVSQPAKVYTNKDLNPVPGGAAPPVAAKDANGKDVKDAAKDPKDAAAKDGKDGDGKDSGQKDQKFWSDKLKALREQLDRDKACADAIQVQINALTTDFVNRDDPVQKRAIEANRTKAIAELQRLTKAIADDNKAISDLQEDARRAGVPAGWLR